MNENFKRNWEDVWGNGSQHTSIYIKFCHKQVCSQLVHPIKQRGCANPIDASFKQQRAFPNPIGGSI